MTLKPPPHEATHWTARTMARAVGPAVSTGQRIWKGERGKRAVLWKDRPTNGLAPDRWRSFKLSNDPAFAEKLHDVVGLYVAPPAHAVALSLDETSQIQALDRTQAGLPLKKGRGPTMTHDCKRHGATTLFAALNILDGTVAGRTMQRRRHQEFIRFLNALERDIPAGKVVHVILDSEADQAALRWRVDPPNAAHKHANVRAWLDRHPR